MKKIILLISATLVTIIATAQMDLPSEGFNIRATNSEEVGITSISIKYSRPGVKGREGKIWGNVVANGFNTMNYITNKNISPWRAGANEATVISFEHDVTVEGKNLKAGSYALFMSIETDSATIIFSKQTEAWGSFFYKPEEEVLRIAVKSVQLEKSVEWLKYEFIEHKEKGCVIAMQWEKLSVPFKVEVDVEKIVLAKLREQVTGPKGFVGGNLIQAARYCIAKNINLEEALSWAQRAVTGRPLAQTGFDTYLLLATANQRLNRMSQADSIMNEGLAIANVGQYILYGRMLVSQKQKDRALEIMLAAKLKFGDVYVVNHGLTYAYSLKGDYAKALEHANKALQQAKNEQAKSSMAANIKMLQEGKDINQ